jgi:integrase
MIVKRGKVWWLRKRVPATYQHIEPQHTISMSLKTDSEVEAMRKAQRVWAEMIAGWEDALDGNTQSAARRFKIAKEDAGRMGLQYRSAADLADISVAEILRRAAAVENPDDAFAEIPRERREIAAFSLADEPQVTVRTALEFFFRHAEDTGSLRAKTERQVKNWRDPRKLVVSQFVENVGDLELAELTRQNMRAFTRWLKSQVDADKIQIATANKRIHTLAKILKTANREMELDLDLPLSDLTLEGAETNTRAAFSREWIKNKLLAPDALGGMNDEARNIALIMVNTGGRVSEISGLKAHHVLLDGPIPMIDVKPEGRELKNKNSKRRIPLVGVSLDAAIDAKMQAEAAGSDDLFPRYAGKGTESAAINKFMRENKLMETPDHTLYGLRHSLEDRMVEAGVLDRIRRDIFGHALQEIRYGTGGGDEVRLEALKKVAL